jgi:hypothetical protein
VSRMPEHSAQLNLAGRPKTIDRRHRTPIESH